MSVITEQNGEGKINPLLLEKDLRNGERRIEEKRVSRRKRTSGWFVSGKIWTETEGVGERECV